MQTHLQHDLSGCIVLQHVVGAMATVQSSQGVVAAGNQGRGGIVFQNFQWIETYLIHL